jgi:hypothetical protein
MATGYTRRGSGVTIRAPRGAQGLGDLADALRILADVEVLVGVPESTTDVRNEDGVEYITNAALAYIHDNGAPEAGIPPRRFMVPGIVAVQEKIANQLRRSATVAFNEQSASAVERAMHLCGLTAQLSIQKTIQQGIPPPLADSTLRQRARRRKGRVGPGLELMSRRMGYAPSTDFVTPLIDTGDMLKSITYVIRSRKERK